MAGGPTHRRHSRLNIYHEFLHHWPTFFHLNIIALCARPFGSVSEMNGRILMNYQTVMSPDDDLWIIGDVEVERSEKSDQLSIMLHSISVRKHLVIKYCAAKTPMLSLRAKVGRGETG